MDDRKQDTQQQNPRNAIIGTFTREREENMLVAAGASVVNVDSFAKDDTGSHFKDDQLLLVPSAQLKNSSDCPLDIMVLLDSSGSIRSEYIKQKQFVRSLIETVMSGRSHNRIALLQFAGSRVQHLEFSFDSYKSTIGMRRAVDRLQHFKGTTYIGSALIKSMNVLNERRRRVPTLVILVSDGYSQDDALTPAFEIRRYGGVQIYAVTLATKNDRRFLEEIVGSQNRVFVGEDEASVFLHILKGINHKLRDTCSQVVSGLVRGEPLNLSIEIIHV